MDIGVFKAHLTATQLAISFFGDSTDSDPHRSRVMAQERVTYSSCDGGCLILAQRRVASCLDQIVVGFLGTLRATGSTQ